MKLPPATATAPAGTALAGRRILLVAEAGPQAGVAALLHEAGALVLQARSRAEALELLRAQADVAAVVLELRSPDCLATAQALRAAQADVPLLAVAAAEPIGADAATAAGIDGLLARPVEKTLLYQALSRFIAGGVPRAPRAEAAAPAHATSVAPELLLNGPRLESYRRLGLLDELVNDYLPEMRRLLAALQEAQRCADQQASLAALHSLLGMSGEAGAQGLSKQVRAIYVPLLERGQWPAAGDWLAQLQQLAARTESALEAYCARPAPPNAA